jgi:hypothetical protein
MKIGVKIGSNSIWMLGVNQLNQLLGRAVSGVNYLSDLAQNTSGGVETWLTGVHDPKEPT